MLWDKNWSKGKKGKSHKELREGKDEDTEIIMSSHNFTRNVLGDPFHDLVRLCPFSHLLQILFTPNSASTDV